MMVEYPESCLIELKVEKNIEKNWTDRANREHMRVA